MKPITEKQQQDLIENCKREISHTKAILLSSMIAPGWRELHERNLLKNEIALASLTAEPVGYCKRHDIESLQSGGFAGVTAFDINCQVPLFTAPPVPVTKLPDESNLPERDNHEH